MQSCQPVWPHDPPGKPASELQLLPLSGLARLEELARCSASSRPLISLLGPPTNKILRSLFQSECRKTKRCRFSTRLSVLPGLCPSPGQALTMDSITAKRLIQKSSDLCCVLHQVRLSRALSQRVAGRRFNGQPSPVTRGSDPKHRRHQTPIHSWGVKIER